MTKGLSAQHLGRADEFQRLVMHAFSLRSVLRKVFLLCEVRGFTIEQAAEILDISTRAATIRLEQARREVRARMQGDTPFSENVLMKQLAERLRLELEACVRRLSRTPKSQT